MDAEDGVRDAGLRLYALAFRVLAVSARHCSLLTFAQLRKVPCVCEYDKDIC